MESEGDLCDTRSSFTLPGDGVPTLLQLACTDCGAHLKKGESCKQSFRWISFGPSETTGVLMSVLLSASDGSLILRQRYCLFGMEGGVRK